MLRTEQPFSVVMLDWVDIVVAEVSNATCPLTSPYDYCDIMLSTLCLHKKIVGSDIEGTLVFFNFVYSSILGEPLQTAYMQS